jgi:hypothetical protein
VKLPRCKGILVGLAALDPTLPGFAALDPTLPDWRIRESRKLEV